MKQDEQQKNGGQPDDEPTNPSPDAARFGIGTSRVLCQSAIFQANDQLYYTLTLICPAAKPLAAPRWTGVVGASSCRAPQTSPPPRQP